VAVGAQADVVGQVEADMVGVFEDGDLIGAPVPIVAEAVVSGEDAEIEAAEPEAFAIAACDAPNVAAAETAGEVAMRPRMIEMVVGVVRAGVVADPLAVGVDMGRFGVAGFIGILWGRSRSTVFVDVRCGLGRRRAVTRNVAVADVFRRLWMAPFFLRKNRNRTEQEKCKNCEK